LEEEERMITAGPGRNGFKIYQLIEIKTII
jgi:hypothetical protein